MIRKIIKIGNSEGVTLPVSVIRTHKIKLGDKVEVIIRPPGKIAQQLEFLQELEDFRKFQSRTPKKPNASQLL